MQSKEKREVELVVISDVHLGTYGCRAEELLNYLRTIRPRTLILNGDIVDIWQFSKSYFPASHMKVIMYITKLLSRGTEVYYITGNHDELLRKFEGFSIGGLKVVNKLVLDLHGEPAWFFHGDVFDVTMEHSKWLAKLGGKGYDLLIMINTVVNWFGKRFGTGRISLSKRIKDSVKGAVKHINDFEG
ncbi:MAG: UDP-2,3-diacylglucosamine diphosphatase, partial [Flavobacteriales bacterium]|nr:UDP-2,3-diacylglucosamine diphosphatase [Flavobacteriales bacterium]